jgi:hypothetical protein
MQEGGGCPQSHTAHTKKSMAAWHVTDSSVRFSSGRVIEHKSLTKASCTKQVGEGGAPVIPELLQVHWVELHVGRKQSIPVQSSVQGRGVPWICRASHHTWRKGEHHRHRRSCGGGGTRGVGAVRRVGVGGPAKIEENGNDRGHPQQKHSDPCGVAATHYSHHLPLAS